MMKKRAIIITGPTATGKTSLAVKLAKVFDGEIISADSRQVYTGLDIGTGKDIEEYGVGADAVKYHLIDICSPKDTYNLKQFNLDAKQHIDIIYKKNKLPIISGGTALYVDSLVSDYDFPISAPNFELRKDLKTQTTLELIDYLKNDHPKVYANIDNKGSRPRLVRAIENLSPSHSSPIRGEISINSTAKDIQWLIIGTFFPRKEVHARIKQRLEQRLDCGMVQEVESLHNSGVSWERLDAFGLEYRYVSRYLRGEINLDEMKNTLLAKIRRLARSQDIWFRKMEKKGLEIYWIPKGSLKETSILVEKFLGNSELPDPEIKLMDIYYGPKS